PSLLAFLPLGRVRIVLNDQHARAFLKPFHPHPRTGRGVWGHGQPCVSVLVRTHAHTRGWKNPSHSSHGPHRQHWRGLAWDGLHAFASTTVPRGASEGPPCLVYQAGQLALE